MEYLKPIHHLFDKTLQLDFSDDEATPKDEPNHSTKSLSLPRSSATKLSMSTPLEPLYPKPGNSHPKPISTQSHKIPMYFSLRMKQIDIGSGVKVHGRCEEISLYQNCSYQRKPLTTVISLKSTSGCKPLGYQ
ncbi:hypothetical protein Salat_2091400 [Sesamum alatum]|uniref:Uncharacterized protein n=1 Tax=Sesamum alatum TaxID=300844 RepID=A0AAE1Y1C8_9LAMI|nr:hypothetical protein Salat_2091400 [Sesamum alatum]